MPILHAIVLGIAQGLTEFLPISSSGHLQLIPWLFGWDDFAGDETLEKAFDVALHIGTLIGVVAYLWNDVVRLTRAGLDALVHPRRPLVGDGRMAWLLMLTAVPAGIVGVTVENQLESIDDKIWLTATTLIVFGLLLLAADRITPGGRKEDEFNLKDAVVVGVAQACALQPGVSRSGVTVTAARGLGFERTDAARIVFLMSIPIIAGAGLFLFVQIGGFGGIPADMRAAFLWGMASSAITGWIAVWFLLKVVVRYGFTPFVIYRVALGLAVYGVLISGWR